MTMSSHERADTGKDEWLTPPEIIRALGEFDLDPCAPINRPWPTAKKHYTIEDNGLLKPWSGRVWLNPPYGNQTDRWVKRLVDHGNGIALIFARTETKTFFPWVWDYADSVFFFNGRIIFKHVNGAPAIGNAGAPSVAVAYGKENTTALAKFSLVYPGKLIILNNIEYHSAVFLENGQLPI